MLRLIFTLAFRAGKKPNIILIYSDDHGCDDLGTQGADRDIPTHHLDAMSREGVCLVRGYATAL